MKSEVMGMEFTARQAKSKLSKSNRPAGAVTENSGALKNSSKNIESALERLTDSIRQRDIESKGQSAHRISAMLKGHANRRGTNHGMEQSGHDSEGDDNTNYIESGTSSDAHAIGGAGIQCHSPATEADEGSRIANADANVNGAAPNGAAAAKAAATDEATAAKAAAPDEAAAAKAAAPDEAAAAKAAAPDEAEAATHDDAIVSRSEAREEAKETKASATAQRPSLLNDMLFLVLKLSAITLAITLLLTFLFGIIRYQEPSMAPAIKDGDLVLYYRHYADGYKPGDAVVMDYNGKRQVRRVIATAGDTVDILEEGLLINGALQQEPEIFQETVRYQDGVDFPLVVPEGQVFVLGDSRAGATDSRIFGGVAIEDTFGKVMTVIRRRSI